MMDNKKVWFITGASKGFGLSLVKQLLEAGELVAATSRNLQELTTAVGATSNHFLPLQVDLVKESSVSLALQQTHETFGKIDVVINNAGYGIGGAIEELKDVETRQAFDVNVFGTLNVIRFAMPFMREQGSGHIINIASIAGIAPGTGWAIYGATKAAVIALTEVLSADVASFGVKATVVIPGAFRTNFLTADSLTMTSTPIEAYQDVRLSHQKMVKMDGAQAGDPEKGAAAIINVVYDENPPLHLLLGGDAYNRALAKFDTITAEIHDWAEVTCATGFDDQSSIN